MTPTDARPAPTGAPRLLLVDDDLTFGAVMARVLRRRGFEVAHASDLAEAHAALSQATPDYALVDLRLAADESGLTLIPTLRAASADMRIVMLTGYASIATAVDAIKLGADQYLAKPVEADDVLRAFEHAPDPERPIAAEPMSVRRLEWEHIHRVLAEHDGNISAAARALNMHRRTLQRKLAKHAVRR